MSHKIDVVHDSDLEGYLVSLELLDSVKNGIFTCHYCGKKITLDNLSCLFPYDQEIHFCCNEPICFRKVLEMRRRISND